MSSTDTGTVGRSLVDFALQGSFPDEVVSSRSVGSQDFGPALQSLAVAKSKIEVTNTAVDHSQRIGAHKV